MGIEPDGIAGHSTGEMVAGYCDGCTSAEETMLCAYYRGKSIIDSNLPLGKFKTNVVYYSTLPADIIVTVVVKQSIYQIISHKYLVGFRPY